MAISVKIEGLDRMLGKLDKGLYSKALRRFFDRAGISVTNEAKKLAPVYTGTLRSSLTHETDPRPHPLFAKVGSRLGYAPYMEFGTGTQSDGEGGTGRRHFPPPHALDKWALRHGFQSGFQVARIIGRRGGLKPRRFLRGGLEKALGDIRQHVNRLANDIASEWGRR